ncbi:putative mitochondrial RNA-editing complex protein MP81 [Leptomonas pyrrhocoris]|uniref:Putative mitochondrial RNA-editing complex protein MP81 n=1 Tax=Leptomonas pyrrhocoris TaxID=157538 RepID=A0A0M9FS88_LEPPY|nr:putative mitochondrial RNA-editing complex protein MP81 [Leptomonas pyrrhocoris]XP_015653376.1 putative mitochondrial RNA-editing complex protein MP81 [Leptomonas pyrrhocoris]KPA74936.1 putative mitochondrial RNA-editing complex protein MP81 [Leptomonas pyrrhocoris]KPA74937.1 putative mitochondrial RNA-editing complex protein MP81 [Leptomonas pyrrhocoris]|eukprot:XP_015653375.1 putative mitochondrial RNA-editing complex protein MP81 [Leptomonas pyrrhocoris]
MLPLCGCAALSASTLSAPALSPRCGLLRRCVPASCRPCISTTGSSSYSTHGLLVGRPTRLLRQSATAAAATTTTAHAGPSTPSDTVAAPTTDAAGPTNDAEIRFYDTFLFSTEDVHLLLLEEAHRKHGVWMNVPPQLAPTVPDVGPPTIPEPLYPPKQQQRLDALMRGTEAARLSRRTSSTSGTREAIHSSDCLAYAPTHAPPPFVTAGTHSLWLTGEAAGGDDSRATAIAAAAAATMVDRSAAANTTTTAAQLTVTVVAIRAPVDQTMLFHCSACGRAFRRREAAKEHVEQRHRHASGEEEEEAEATVLEGPGLGEITGYKNVVGSSTVNSPAAAPNAASTATATMADPLKNTAAVASPSAGARATLSGAASATLKGVSAPTRNESGAAAAATTTAGEPAATAATSSPSSKLAPSSSRLERAVTSYLASPTVILPEDDLVDELLSSVWDEVGLKRSDIAKAAGVQGSTAVTASDRDGAAMSARPAAVNAAHVDSCNGKLFIPSSAFVHGKADIRAELEAELASKPLARATPEGAAPGVRRPNIVMSSANSKASLRLQTRRRNPDGTVTLALTDAMTASVGGAGLSAAPTALEMSIAELSRHYPNPFGNSPNAALVEQEKEPVNPFRDVEGTMAAAAAREEASRNEVAGVNDAGGGNESCEKSGALRCVDWQARFASRPYACPVCQRRALPGFTAALEAVSAPSFASAVETELTGTTGLSSSESSTAIAGDGGGGASASAANATASSSSNRSAPLTDAQRHANGKGRQVQKRKSTSPSPAGGTAAAAATPADASITEVDEEALRWYESTVPRFRLLDALENHVEACHEVREAPLRTDPGNSAGGTADASAAAAAATEEEEEEVTEADWQRLYRVAASPMQSAATEMLTVRRVYRAVAAAKARRAASLNSSSSASSLSTTTAATAYADGERGVRTRSAEAPGASTDDVPAGGAGLHSTAGGSSGSAEQIGVAKTPGDDAGTSAGADDASDALADADAPHVHVRAAVNTVLVGVVRDVQEGFVGATRVLQYVLAVRNSIRDTTAMTTATLKSGTTTPSSASSTSMSSSDASVAAAATGAEAEEQKRRNEDDVELVVVRCMGDLLPAALLHQQVHIGATVFVTGTLRMNRNVDTASRRSHAYPYVQVVPPLGSVRVVK